MDREGPGRAVEGAVPPSLATPDEAAAVQKQLRVVQWVLPLLTGVSTVLSAVQSEQRRPAWQFGGVARLIEGRSRRLASNFID